MQGSFDSSDEKNGLKAFIIKALDNPTSASDLISIDKISQPSSLDSAVDRFKSNMAKFSFWYLIILASVNLIFIFFNKLILLPIIITVGWLYLSTYTKEINGYTITPQRAVIACIVLQLILCFFSRSIAASYVYFLAVNGLGALIVLAHGMLLRSEAEESAV